MKKIFTREILIGLILVFTLSVLFVGIDFLKGSNVFRSTNLYYVSFADVTGLTDASPVTLNGMKVGQVTGINFDYNDPSQVAVEVNLDSGIKLTKGSTMELSTSLLGIAELKIRMAKSDSFYEDGAHLQGSNKKDLMAEVSNQVLPQIIEVLPRLNHIVANIDSLSSNPALFAAISRLDAVARNVEVLTAHLASSSRKVDPILGNVDSLTVDLAAVSADLKQISAELKKMPIAETVGNVKATTDNLNQITAKINGKDSSLGMLLNDKGLYNHIDSTILSLDSILIDLKAHPKRYVQFKLF